MAVCLWRYLPRRLSILLEDHVEVVDVQMTRWPPLERFGRSNGG
jgi:hypothetical protein